LGLIIGWLMRRGIEPHIPLLDRERRTKGFFTRADFTFDPQTSVFVCPGGKQLRSTGLVREDGTVPYWASTKDCRACALKPRCTKGSKRIVTRNLFEAEREHVRALKRVMPMPAHECYGSSWVFPRYRLKDQNLAPVALGLYRGLVVCRAAAAWLASDLHRCAARGSRAASWFPQQERS
jgi:hypothetical protein